MMREPDFTHHAVERLKAWARALKRDVTALALALRDPRTPWTAKALAALVVAYALSPIDLIPDFVPVLGYLDDLILLPLGIALVVRLIPKPLMRELRERAASMERLPKRWSGAIIVIIVWIILAVTIGVGLLSLS
jgi:uncharacterized membrane protein YkvA (DUF1232 family)